MIPCKSMIGQLTGQPLPVHQIGRLASTHLMSTETALLWQVCDKD